MLGSPSGYGGNPQNENSQDRMPATTVFVDLLQREFVESCLAQKASASSNLAPSALMLKDNTGSGLNELHNQV